MADRPHPRFRSAPFLLPAWLRHGYIPLLVLAATLFIAYQAWKSTQSHIYQEQQIRFHFRSNEAYNHIIERMAAYEQVLRGIQGLFAASDRVSRREFHSYVTTLALDENFPGIQGVGFVPLVHDTEKAAHIAALRAEGFHNYTIKPSGTRPVYAPVGYIEPFSGSNLRAFGYDLLSESARRAALEWARDHGTAAITSKVCLVQSTGTNPQAGFLMYLPVYRTNSLHNTLAQRRNNLIGWVGAPFWMNDLMVGILGGRDDEVDIEIYDGAEPSDANLMYDNDLSRHTNGTRPRFQASRPLEIAGHRWTMVVSSLPLFENGDNGHDTLLVAVTGISASILLTLITWLLVRGRSRALQAAHAERVTAQALQEAEKLAKIGHFDYNPRTDETYWSEGLERIWGFEPGTRHRQFHEFLATIHPDDLQTILDSDADKNWHETSTEFRIIRADGAIRHICSYGYREFAPDGTITRVFGINKDITDRKHTEEAILHSRDYYLQLLESFPALVWRAGLDGKCDYFNHTWLTFTGRSLAEELGYGWADGVHPDDISSCLHTYYAAFECRQPFSMEYRLRCHDGTYRWIVDHGSPYYDQNGTFAGYIGSCYDIHAQKTAELALKEAHEQLEQRVAERTAELTEANLQLGESRSLLTKAQQQARLGCWKWDLHRNLITWSDELYALFGCNPEQPPPAYAKCGSLFTQESYNRLDHAIAHALATGDDSKLNLDLEIVRTDGTHRYCLGHGEIICDEAGQITQLHGTLQDVTEWKLLEQQLFEAKKLESIGQLVSGVAHEVRNPLNAILAVTEALFREKSIEDNPEFEPYIQHIRNQVKRLAHLMSDLLDLGKPIQPTNIQQLPLRALCHEAVELWPDSNGNSARRIRLIDDLHDEPLVMADGIKLQQAIFNLLDNAAQHSPATTEIIVSLLRSKNARSACIYVTDAGHGIPADRISRVFEPFYSKRKGGTGLGLALVKHFIEGMGGSVAIWNNVSSSGCTAEICIPLAPEELV